MVNPLGRGGFARSSEWGLRRWCKRREKGPSSVSVKDKLGIEEKLLLVRKGNTNTGIEDELFRSKVSALS